MSSFVGLRSGGEYWGKLNGCLISTDGVSSAVIYGEQMKKKHTRRKVPLTAIVILIFLFGFALGDFISPPNVEIIEKESVQIKGRKIPIGESFKENVESFLKYMKEQQQKNY